MIKTFISDAKKYLLQRELTFYKSSLLSFGIMTVLSPFIPFFYTTFNFGLTIGVLYSLFMTVEIRREEA